MENSYLNCDPITLAFLWLCEHTIEESKTNFKGMKATETKKSETSEKILTVVVIYFILYFPIFFVTFYHQILGLNIQTYNHYSSTETLAFINSCSNPFICCWRKRKILQRVKDLPEKIVS